MSRISLRVLSRLAPVFWLTAIGIVVFRHFDAHHTADGYLMGDAMLLGLLGLAGTMCGALCAALGRDPSGARTRREAAQLLLRALDSMPEQTEDGHSRLRVLLGGSGQSATPAPTPAREESSPRPGA